VCRRQSQSVCSLEKLKLETIFQPNYQPTLAQLSFVRAHSPDSLGALQQRQQKEQNRPKVYRKLSSPSANLRPSVRLCVRLLVCACLRRDNWRASCEGKTINRLRLAPTGLAQKRLLPKKSLHYQATIGPFPPLAARCKSIKRQLQFYRTNLPTKPADSCSFVYLCPPGVQSGPVRAAPQPEYQSPRRLVRLLLAPTSCWVRPSSSH